jgi:hypothetical protein
MKSVILLIAFLLVGTFGCRQKTQDRGRQTTAVDIAESLIDGPVSSSDLDRNAEIVNSFGMKFVRIAIDPNLHVHSDPPYPVETYYIQETEISGEHIDNLRAFAETRNTGPSAYMNIPTAEWRDYSDLAELMSKYDPDFDYRLPTKSEWVFACMSGYEQRCIRELKDESRANAYGLIDMLDGDVECVSEIGVLMGLWKESWPGIYDGYEKPSCACKWWTICNPDADDSLNEIIVARFVLVPEGGVPPETP